MAPETMDSTADPASAPAASAGSPRPADGNGRAPFHRQPRRIALLAGTGLALILAGGWYWFHALQFVSTDDAFLKGQPVQIAPRVAGPVARVLVEENEEVERGATLVRIDPTDFRVALDRARARHDGAQARLAGARAELGTVRAEVEAATARLEVARTEVRNAEADLTRLRNIDPQYVEQRQLDNAADRLDQTRAQRRAAAREVAARRARVNSARAGIEDARAALSEAQAGVRQAELEHSYTTISAPAAGQLAAVGVEAGEYVKPGQALMTLVPRRVWVKANFKETQITHMRPGQPVEIEIDAYPGRSFKGHVVAIQRATGSTFDLLPPQNASGNFVKVVQRVPVRIAFDERPEVHTLAPGLSVVPTVRVLAHPPWPWSDSDTAADGQ